jgi:5,10-methylenetetrahydromethanopterin reductase
MSPPVRLGLALSNEVPLARTALLARRAEELGLAEVWLAESSHGRTTTAAATVVGHATSAIGIGLGVVNPFWRHPSLIAMEAATIDEAIGGRLRLGLGAAIWTLRALGEADERTRRPLTAMAEAIRVTRAILRGEPGPGGSVYTVRPDARLDFEPLRRDIPIYVGAVNPKMMEATGELADGAYLGAITSPGYVRWARERIATGAARGGRDPDSMDVIANVLVGVSENRRAARDAVRPVLAYYLDRVEDVVRAESGADPEALAAARAAVQELGVEKAGARLPEELIDVFAAAGTPDEVAAALRRFVDAGLKGVLAWHVLGPDPERGLALLAAEAWPAPALSS